MNEVVMRMQGWRSGESAHLPPMCPGFDFRTWGPCLESPGNLTGPKSYFEIKVSGKVGCVLTSNEFHFVSLADNVTFYFSNLLKLQSEMENKKGLKGSVITGCFKGNLHSDKKFASNHTK